MSGWHSILVIGRRQLMSYRQATDGTQHGKRSLFNLCSIQLKLSDAWITQICNHSHQSSLGSFELFELGHGFRKLREVVLSGKRLWQPQAGGCLAKGKLGFGDHEPDAAFT